jgi:hypothetical protein
VSGEFRSVLSVAPVVGAAIAVFVHKALLEGKRPEPPITGRLD